MKTLKSLDEELVIIGVKEVSRLLNINPRTITNMAKKGIILGVKLGPLWRFNRKTILSLAP